MSDYRFGTSCAVVVTYNRKELLLKCIKSITAQSRKLDTIIIVDNASTDNTLELLIEEGITPTTSKIRTFGGVKLSCRLGHLYSGVNIVYLRCSENIGGAGGFSLGQKFAFDRGYEWIWMMDDDGSPHETCFDVLRQQCQEHCILALNPLVVDQLNHDQLAFGLTKNINSVSAAKNIAENLLIYNVANPFNGTLLHYTVIQKIGFIKSEMFIWGDEREYFLRLRDHEITYATSVSALFYHPTSKTKYVYKWFKMFRVAQKPETLEMNYYRNQGYINRRYKNILSHKTIIKYIFYFILNGNFKKCVLYLMYYLDGVLDIFKLPNIRN